jgi:hypothetical protein
MEATVQLCDCALVVDMRSDSDVLLGLPPVDNIEASERCEAR